ncbi:MAG: hypothetical protein IKN43_06780 [Selenomonadaceae bacterium]|nr:hypothetical protein [Selenomonadaceae bacterium]
MQLDKEHKLTNEELEQVAGGHCGDSYKDMRQAYERQMPGFEKLDPESLDTMVYCLKNWDTVVGDLKNMFAQYGIEMTYKSDPLEDNLYMYQGRRITNGQAWQILDSQRNP